MKAALIGAGGHARVVLDAARSCGFEVVAVLDRRRDLIGRTFEGVLVIGDESVLDEARRYGAEDLLLGVGSIDVGHARRALYERLVGRGFSLPPVLHRSAIVSPSATVGAATVVFAGAILNPRCVLGKNVIVNTGAIVEHDVRIADHVHVSPGAHLAGGVVVGDLSHIGIGATVIQSVRIGTGVVVGAGAVVLHDVADGDRVVGVPARSIRAKRLRQEE